MAPKTSSGKDSKYFSTNKKGFTCILCSFLTLIEGELVELKAQLSENDPRQKVEGVKKVIAAMTVGKDVSSLFPNVVQCMQTGLYDFQLLINLIFQENLELKKLVYLYLMNYAKSNPDLAILVVNTFVKVEYMIFENVILFFTGRG